MPKPLLSGYFNSNLNSVHNVNEVMKSIDSEYGIQQIKQSLEDEKTE